MELGAVARRRRRGAPKGQRGSAGSPATPKQTPKGASGPAGSPAVRRTSPEGRKGSAGSPATLRSATLDSARSARVASAWADAPWRAAAAETVEKDEVKREIKAEIEPDTRGTRRIANESDTHEEPEAKRARQGEKRVYLFRRPSVIDWRDL